MSCCERAAWMIAVLCAAAGVCSAPGRAAAAAGEKRMTQPQIAFQQSAAKVQAYDFVEVTLKVSSPSAANPFTDVEVSGSFRRKGGKPIPVDGFCDSADGRVFGIRFMPAKPGAYSYSVTYRQKGFQRTHKGTFRADDGKRRGLLRVDAKHPWHFLWEGTGEHYFWNGTTTYWLMGWDDENIRRNIERLGRLKVNRLRVAINGRVKNGRAWYEHVYPTDKFTFLLNPWVAKRPGSVGDPGFDVTRFNVPHWRKYDRLLRHARDRDVIVSVIFYVDIRRPGVDPFGKRRAGRADEQRYYRYAVARFAAFSNVTWDLCNEYRFGRTDHWANKMGALLKQWDPYDHLASTHGFGDFRFRKSGWADFAMYQRWDEHGGHAFMLKNRALQAATGRIIPQINEEYGYEDHYPKGWGGSRVAPARSADTRRRLAWEMVMAGCYQTTGERADTGTGWGPDSGGGWLNGRGDKSMVMLNGYARIVDFFTALEWWKAEPHDELVTGGAMCLAEPGRQYVVYLPAGGSVTVKLARGTYRASWFNPRSGRRRPIGRAKGPKWTSPAAPDKKDWVVLLLREAGR